MIILILANFPKMAPPFHQCLWHWSDLIDDICHRAIKWFLGDDIYTPFYLVYSRDILWLGSLTNRLHIDAFASRCRPDQPAKAKLFNNFVLDSAQSTTNHMGWPIERTTGEISFGAIWWALESWNAFFRSNPCLHGVGRQGNGSL